MEPLQRHLANETFIASFRRASAPQALLIVKCLHGNRLVPPNSECFQTSSCRRWSVRLPEITEQDLRTTFGTAIKSTDYSVRVWVRIFNRFDDATEHVNRLIVTTVAVKNIELALARQWLGIIYADASGTNTGLIIKDFCRYTQGSWQRPFGHELNETCDVYGSEMLSQAPDPGFRSTPRGTPVCSAVRM